MTTKKLHWTQTPEGRARMAEIARAANNAATARKAKFKEMSKDIVQSVKKYKPRKSGQTVLIINGWKVSLEPDIIRLDSE